MHSTAFLDRHGRVVELLDAGQTWREAAEALRVSESTIRRHALYLRQQRGLAGAKPEPMPRVTLRKYKKCPPYDCVCGRRVCLTPCPICDALAMLEGKRLTQRRQDAKEESGPEPRAPSP